LQNYIRSLEDKYCDEYASNPINANYAEENDDIQVNPMIKIRLKLNKEEVEKEMNF